MKLIMAIVQPSRFEVVKESLTRAGVKGLTMTDAHGVGRQRGHTEVYRGHEYMVNLISKVKIEIAVEAGEVDKVVDIIMKSARSGDEGKIGDGKIFVLPLEDVVRLRTGEVGAAAL
jgi:nitrogen regulatory protein PII